MNHISDILNDTGLIDDDFSTQNNTVLINPSLDFNNLEEEAVDTPSEKNDNLNKKEIKKQIYKIKDQLDSLLRLVGGETLSTTVTTQADDQMIIENGEKIIEGVFNGEKMIGPDGQEYAVPVNYASKSKIVEGDLMKLTVTQNGKFIYKQIGPIKRKRVIGILIFEENKQLWFVEHEGKRYKILTASITFYKGKPGDEVIIFIPKDGQSNWGAVENIISK